MDVQTWPEDLYLLVERRFDQLFMYHNDTINLILFGHVKHKPESCLDQTRDQVLYCEVVRSGTEGNQGRGIKVNPTGS